MHQRTASSQLNVRPPYLRDQPTVAGVYRQLYGKTTPFPEIVSFKWFHRRNPRKSTYGRSTFELTHGFGYVVFHNRSWAKTR
jgi:hypothetical protein